MLESRTPSQHRKDCGNTAIYLSVCACSESTCFEVKLGTQHSKGTVYEHGFHTAQKPPANEAPSLDLNDPMQRAIESTAGDPHFIAFRLAIITETKDQELFARINELVFFAPCRRASRTDSYIFPLYPCTPFLRMKNIFLLSESKHAKTLSGYWSHGPIDCTFKL